MLKMAQNTHKIKSLPSKVLKENKMAKELSKTRVKKYKTRKDFNIAILKLKKWPIISNALKQTKIIKLKYIINV